MMMLMKYLTNSRISITQYGIWLYHYFHSGNVVSGSRDILCAIESMNYFSKNKEFICI